MAEEDTYFQFEEDSLVGKLCFESMLLDKRLLVEENREIPFPIEVLEKELYWWDQWDFLDCLPHVQMNRSLHTCIGHLQICFWKSYCGNTFFKIFALHGSKIWVGSCLFKIASSHCLLRNRLFLKFGFTYIIYTSDFLIPMSKLAVISKMAGSCLLKVSAEDSFIS